MARGGPPKPLSAFLSPYPTDKKRPERIRRDIRGM